MGKARLNQDASVKSSGRRVFPANQGSFLYAPQTFGGRINQVKNPFFGDKIH